MHESLLEPELELKLINEHDGWSTVYQHVCLEAQQRFELSHSDARRTEFKTRNRYQDVSPYDHSRIRLKRNNIDYINASRIEVPRAARAYILTQGPLPQTVSHFWVMVWEKRCPAILMLNRFVEKDQPKCHPYLPGGGVGSALPLTDVDLEVTHVEDQKSSPHFVTRLLRIRDTKTNESHDVVHFHYLPWPDFGVPPSPDSFLDFLFLVRQSGTLDDPERLTVVHCSAGVGRSGVFCLVDACLKIAEMHGSSRSVDVRGVLVEMRRYRMGLIQTPQQLRFAYVALVGALRRLNLSQGEKQLSPDEEMRFLAVNFNSSPTGEPESPLCDDEEEEEEEDCQANGNNSGPPRNPGRSRPSLVRVRGRVADDARKSGKRCSLGRFAPHPGSVEDPESVWILNNSTVSGEPVVIMPGGGAPATGEEVGCHGDREGSPIEEDDYEDDDEDDSEGTGSSDVDGKDEKKMEAKPFVRRPLSERKKKSWLEIEEMSRRQEQQIPELERRRRRRRTTKIKLLAWSAAAVVGVLAVVVYRNVTTP